METKKLGFGLMRLPKRGEDIDLEQTCAMVDAFLARGFTYFDTAYAYAGSEEAFRRAVVERYPRERFTVATKLAGWALREDFRPADMFALQCRRMGVDYVDYYLLHALQRGRKSLYEDYDCWNFGLRLREEGRVRHLGFSYHDDPQFLDELLTEHPEVDFVQLQINYLDWEDKEVQARANYEVCCRHKKPVVVMEPVKGGLLADPRPEVARLFAGLDAAATPASYALRFAAELDNVMMVLSGMSDLGQMEDNLRTLAEPRPLSPRERATVEEARRVILSAPTVPCTACRYCVEGCPQHIDIPQLFRQVNALLTYGERPGPHTRYRELLAKGESGPASACVACGQCEGACPQHLPIIEQLKKASALLDV